MSKTLARMTRMYRAEISLFQAGASLYLLLFRWHFDEPGQEAPVLDQGQPLR